jgi:hypothetical protein
MRKKIGELLLESGAVSQEQIRKALGKQRAVGQGHRLGAVIVTLGFASSEAVAHALARQFDLPFVELPEIPEHVRSLVSRDFQAEHRLVPFRLEKEERGERLHVAVDDPSDLSIVDELRFQLNKPIRVFVAAADDLDRALDLVRGQMVEPLALEDEDAGSGAELDARRAVSELLDGGPPAPPPPPEQEDDDALTLLTPRPAMKPMPPVPPPPIDDEDDAITLITPRAALKPRATGAPPPPPPQESEEVLDELLGESESASSASAASHPSVPVVVFGGAAQGLPRPPPAPELPTISEEDLRVLEDIERIAEGGEATLHTEKVKPARMVASLIRLLIRKRIIREEEFLEELSRK